MTRVNQQDDELNLTAPVKNQDDGRMKARMMARMTNIKNQLRKENLNQTSSYHPGFQDDGALTQDESS